MNLFENELCYTIRTMLYVEGYDYWHFEQRQYTIFTNFPKLEIYFRPEFLIRRYRQKNRRRITIEII